MASDSPSVEVICRAASLALPNCRSALSRRNPDRLARMRSIQASSGI